MLLRRCSTETDHQTLWCVSSFLWLCSIMPLPDGMLWLCQLPRLTRRSCVQNGGRLRNIAVLSMKFKMQARCKQAQEEKLNRLALTRT